jgi:hypothetical protein
MFWLHRLLHFLNTNTVYWANSFSLFYFQPNFCLLHINLHRNENIWYGKVEAVSYMNELLKKVWMYKSQHITLGIHLNMAVNSLLTLVAEGFQRRQKRIKNSSPAVGGTREFKTHVCMYKGWAVKLALVPWPLMIYCASPLAAAMIITVAALRIVLAHGSKPT